MSGEAASRPPRRGGEEADDPAAALPALHGLICQHLAAQGVPPGLVDALREALDGRGGGGGDGARGADSELLRLFRAAGVGTAEKARGGRGSSSVPGAAGSRPRGGRAGEAEEGQEDGMLRQPRQRPAAACGSAAKGRAPCCGCLPIAVVVLLSFIFLPCVTYSEWYIDELFAAVRNADARGETPLRQVLSHDFWGNSLWDGGWTHKSYRPLVVLSYAYQYAFNGGIIKPQALRAFNVALHSANSVMLYCLLRRFKASWNWACLGAALFATHPVHCENVIYLVGRADAMATHCWLLALLTWPLPRATHKPARASRLLRAALATLLALVGGLCKEIGFCVLLQLAVGELLGPWPLRGSAPLLAVFGMVFLGRSWFTDGTKAGFSYVDTPVQYHDNAAVRFCTYLYFHAKYAQLLVFPWTLSWDYSYDALPLLHATWRDPRMLLVCAVYLGAAAAAAWALVRRSRHALLGVSNVLIPFVPASNLFFVVGVTVGERLLYPCNVGGAMLLAAMGTRQDSASPSLGGGGGRRCRSGCGGLVLGFGLLAVFVCRGSLRVFQWSSREHLFGPDAISYPRSTKTRHQIGTVLHREGRFDEALIHFQSSLDIFSQSALTEYCIAQIFIETGRAEEARVRFEKIFAGHGLGFGRFNIYTLYVDYGFSLMMLQRYEDAIPHLMHGLSLNEDVPHGLNALGYSLMRLQRPQEAQGAFQRGLGYDPANPWLLNNLGVARMMLGDLEAGSQHLAAAVQMEPKVQSFVYNIQLVKQMVETNRWPEHQFALELFFNRGN